MIISFRNPNSYVLSCKLNDKKKKKEKDNIDSQIWVKKIYFSLIWFYEVI